MNYHDMIFVHEDQFRQAFKEKYGPILDMDITENGVYIDGKTRLVFNVWVAAHESALGVKRPTVDDFLKTRTREPLQEIIEVLAGLEGFIPETAAEGYLQRALKQIEEICRTLPPLMENE